MNFSTLYNFLCEVRYRVVANDKITLIQARDAQFANMTRAHLLSTRAACYQLAEAITEYVAWQDSRDVDIDEAK